jgi:hypothetical protein
LLENKGPEGLDKKTSEFGLNEYSVQIEKLTCTHIHKSALIIDCHWHGFGGIRDRFDPILPPAFIASIAFMSDYEVLCPGYCLATKFAMVVDT